MRDVQYELSIPLRFQPHRRLRAVPFCAMQMEQVLLGHPNFYNPKETKE